MPILTVSGVQKIYRNNGRRLHALDDISFTVEENEFVTLVGPSGCGKSTLLKIAGELIERTAGEVRFTHERAGRRLQRLRQGADPQDGAGVQVGPPR